jgi:hypothetical protein
MRATFYLQNGETITTDDEATKKVWDAFQNGLIKSESFLTFHNSDGTKITINMRQVNYIVRGRTIHSPRKMAVTQKRDTNPGRKGEISLMERIIWPLGNAILFGILWLVTSQGTLWHKFFGVMFLWSTVGTLIGCVVALLDRKAKRG